MPAPAVICPHANARDSPPTLPYAATSPAATSRKAKLSLLFALAGLGLYLLLLAFIQIAGKPTGDSPLKVPIVLILCSTLVCSGAGALLGLADLLRGKSKRLGLALVGTLVSLLTIICLANTS